MSLVLVADDEPAVLEVLTEVVEDLGHDVLRAHDGREALHLARAQRPSLVVTDHMMPRLSGVELCRAMRSDEVLHAVPVILLSAAIPPEAEEANAWLSKPFELDEFEALVRRTLEGSGARPDGVQTLRQPAQQGLADPAQELIRWVAHEIKTPLAAARMNLQLLERKLAAGGGAPDRHHFKSVSRQLESMEQLVNSLLDASRLAQGELMLTVAPEDLHAVVDNTLAQFRATYPDYDFEHLPSEGSLQVRIDVPRVGQVLSQLLSNAVRYGAPPRHVRVEVQRREGHAELTVQDFGQGISQAAQRTLFDRNRMTEAGGSKRPGLGLYLARELARLHGGELSVRSSPGQGARFVLSLPLA
jgi:two-component system, sensor histidine kinase and response regulator